MDCAHPRRRYRVGACRPPVTVACVRACVPLFLCIYVSRVPGAGDRADPEYVRHGTPVLGRDESIRAKILDSVPSVFVYACVRALLEQREQGQPGWD